MLRIALAELRDADVRDTAAQLAALAATINASEAEVVVSGTPCDLARLVALDKPVVRARYEFAERVPGTLEAIVRRFLVARGLASG